MTHGRRNGTYFFFCKHFLNSSVCLFSTLVTPYRIAFLNDTDADWLMIEVIIDIIYFFDIVFSFLSAYHNLIEELIDDRKTIACNYLKFWFIVDFISILPVNYIFNSEDVNSLGQLARIPRIYRISKTFK